MPIGDRAREENIVSSETKQIFRRVCLRISENPLNDIDFDNCLLNKDVCFSNGVYEIIYRPISKQVAHAREYPYVIRCDLLKQNKIRVKDWNMLYGLSKKDPVVAWILKWTTISKEMFDCAKVHFMLPLTFTIKYIDYWNFLSKKNPDCSMQLSKLEWMSGDKYRAERLASR